VNGVLTLEEAIGIFEQLSKLCETNGIHDSQELYKQYAAWLRELVERRKAPEIIRCGECRHRDPEDKKCDCGHDIIWQLPRGDDWYCADAERRFNGENLPE
jgi:hypothetical protein